MKEKQIVMLEGTNTYHCERVSCERKESVAIRNGGDAVHLGPGHCIAKFYNSNIGGAVDEAVSLFGTGRVVFDSCTISNDDRGILVGTGDAPVVPDNVLNDEDAEAVTAYWLDTLRTNRKWTWMQLHNTVIAAARRLPMMWYGTCIMRGCTLIIYKQASKPFEMPEKRYGARAKSGAVITLSGCTIKSKFAFEPLQWVRGMGWFRFAWEDGGKVLVDKATIATLDPVSRFINKLFKLYTQEG